MLSREFENLLEPFQNFFQNNNSESLSTFILLLSIFINIVMILENVSRISFHKMMIFHDQFRLDYRFLNNAISTKFDKGRKWRKRKRGKNCPFFNSSEIIIITKFFHVYTHGNVWNRSADSKSLGLKRSRSWIIKFRHFSSITKLDYLLMKPRPYDFHSNAIPSRI